ncbi:hypothetical protein COT82_02735 [Candidatus Campbellbacteria bacterium CG10_big_fil_rev_8_21_14_0_10_35_52]|uniref:DUF721 domain-containing protein n=1 Tax=Candidatus Campbellbacteria bacterium CG10_big_fil_rev_8_21_14_0_10_35_52 TaxID=1974527 RepID=A0A2M6WUP9_9BACT|nr:MAG: hypothetical protein COT82_02735 [Candidatus Campbellbacteria bacterium CG10_big_fil_rev_8_21_14_0_10_35_52]
MFNISNFLEKFKNITPPNKFIKDIFISVVKNTTNILLKKNDLDVRNGTIFISTDPIIKNEIFLQKDEIMKQIVKNLNKYKKTIRDMR